MEPTSIVVSLDDYRRRQTEPSPPQPSTLSPPDFHWKLSQRGNPYIVVKDTHTDESFHIVVFRQAGGSWSFRIENMETGRARFSTRRYGTEDEAKADALDWV
jgi:hypothetical protein